MKKIRILVITLVIAFAVLGGAYALWYDSLYINETVETGQLDIDWYCSITSDGGGDYFETDGLTDHKEQSNLADFKNIGSTNVLSEDDSEFPDVNGVPDERNTKDTVKIDLKNCYPGYQENVVTVLQNIGDIPVKLQNLQPTSSIPSWLRVQIIDGNTGAVYYDSHPDANTTVISLDGTQVDPGRWVKLAFIQRVLDGAPQNHNNSGSPQEITFQVEGVQWNAYNFSALPNEIQ